MVVPLVSFAIVLRASARTNLGNYLWTLARFGLPRRALALGAIAAMTVASGTLSAVFGALAVLSTGGHPLAELSADALTSASIGALTSAAYSRLVRDLLNPWTTRRGPNPAASRRLCHER